MFLEQNPITYTDHDFDQFYPKDIVNLSRTHWSSIHSIQVALDFFAARLCLDAKILDIGSGVGKFCVYGSLISTFYFTGIERRKKLFDVSNKSLAKIKNNRVSFLLGDALYLNWNDFDGIYLYNPFYEHKIPQMPEFHIDSETDYSVEKFNVYTRKTFKKLSQLKAGTCVVILNGYGGEMPPHFIQHFCKKVDGLDISLWQKEK